MSIRKASKTTAAPNELEPREKRLKVDHGQIENLSSFFAGLINYGLVAVLTVVLFFAVSFPIMRNDGNYLKQEAVSQSVLEKYSLNYPESGKTDEKTEALIHFYLDCFPNEIARDFNKERETDYSIQHIFNILVYQLPENPSPSDYQTTYFSYLLDEHGIPLVDSLGYARIDELGSRGLEDLAGIIQSAYARLLVLAGEYVDGYKYAVNYCLNYESVARIIPYWASVFIALFILPLFFRNGASLGEKIMHLGYANKRTGYSVSLWKLPLKALLYGSFATMAAYLFYPHFVLIFAVFPYFLNALYRLFSDARRGVIEKFLFMIPVDLRIEKLYRNEAELLQDGETLIAGYSDSSYTATLSAVETISMEDRGDGAH